jgi:hypothetical protein
MHLLNNAENSYGTNDFHDIRKWVEEYGYPAHYGVLENKIKTKRDTGL